MSEATLDKWKARAAAAEANRAAMPEVTRFVEELKQTGFAPRVTFASEAGREVGKRDNGAVFQAVP